MLGLAAVGVAVIAGIGLRLSAAAGALMMLMMWAAEWGLGRRWAALTGDHTWLR